MRYNGTIRYYQSSGDAELNEYGEITEPVGTDGWSEPISCSVQTVRNDNVRRTADNVERVCSFIVLLPASSGFDFRSRNKVRLERHGEDLGEFEVITSELVSTQGRIKLVV
jgi:hypothetical protein